MTIKIKIPLQPQKTSPWPSGLAVDPKKIYQETHRRPHQQVFKPPWLTVVQLDASKPVSDFLLQQIFQFTSISGELASSPPARPASVSFSTFLTNKQLIFSGGKRVPNRAEQIKRLSDSLSSSSEQERPFPLSNLRSARAEAYNGEFASLPWWAGLLVDFFHKIFFFSFWKRTPFLRNGSKRYLKTSLTAVKPISCFTHFCT